MFQHRPPAAVVAIAACAYAFCVFVWVQGATAGQLAAVSAAVARDPDGYILSAELQVQQKPRVSSLRAFGTSLSPGGATRMRREHLYKPGIETESFCTTIPEEKTKNIQL